MHVQWSPWSIVISPLVAYLHPAGYLQIDDEKHRAWLMVPARCWLDLAYTHLAVHERYPNGYAELYCMWRFTNTTLSTVYHVFILGTHKLRLLASTAMFQLSHAPCSYPATQA